MTNTEKLRILKAMRELIEQKTYNCFCQVYAKVVCGDSNKWGKVSEQNLNEIGLYKPAVTYDNNYWHSPFDNRPRLEKIDEAILKFKNITMNKTEIQSQMKSIEENIAKETERLNKLRAEMDKPEKPTLEEMCNNKSMYVISSMGNILTTSECRRDCFLSFKRAQKELLRIRLSVIADYFNGGLFEPEATQDGYYLCLDRKGKVFVENHSRYYLHGFIYFKTREHAELAKTYFTNNELIKMLK